MLESACGRIQKIVGVHYLYNQDRKIKIDNTLEVK
jgi:hypothetical protein